MTKNETINSELSVAAYCAWFMMGGRRLILSDGRIVHYTDFMDNYGKLDEMGYSGDEICDILGRQPRNDKEKEMVKEVLGRDSLCKIL